MKVMDNTKTNKHTSHRQRGFTLVELMISIAVMTILAGMAAQTFSVVLDARDLAIKRLEISETARSALDYMSVDLRSAYLTPDSYKAVQGQVNLRSINQAPRFRFAGIYRDVVADPDDGVPGAGEDDDGDGRVDEEILDGFDADYPSGAESALTGRGNPVPDEYCEEGDPRCIDEDIGVFPSDILHFVSAIENSGDIVLQEISYGLDPSGTKLIRRAQVLSFDSASSSEQIRLFDFGQFVDNTTNKRLLPLPVRAGNFAPSMADVNQAIENWRHGSRYGTLQSANSPWTNKNPGKLFQVLAYDVRGLRFRYWYYDYNRGGWRWCKEWDSSRETALLTPQTRIFTQPASNSSIEGNNKFSFENIIVNEPEDMYPRATNSLNQFLIGDPTMIRPNSNNQRLWEKITKKTDGLPNMVEITVYVQDRDRDINPRPYTTRVFIPNNYRSIGL